MKKKIIYLCVAIEVNDDEVHQQKEIDRNIQSILNIKIYDNIGKKSVAPLSAGVITPGNTIQRLFDVKQAIFDHQDKLGINGTAHLVMKLQSAVQAVLDETPFKSKLLQDFKQIFKT